MPKFLGSLENEGLTFSLEAFCQTADGVALYKTDFQFSKTTKWILVHSPTVQPIATGLLELDAFNACTFHEVGKDSLAQMGGVRTGVRTWESYLV